jgi:hypothetical protein
MGFRKLTIVFPLGISARELKVPRGEADEKHLKGELP